MSSVYKKIEVVGTSDTTLGDAIRNAVSRAGETVKNMGWFEVAEIRGRIRDGAVAEFQVTVKVGFRIE